MFMTILCFIITVVSGTYSNGKKNLMLKIKITENVNVIHAHCRRLIITYTDAVLCLYNPLYEMTLLISYIICCGLNYSHF